MALKSYKSVAFAVDLIAHEYQTKDPLIIFEKIATDLEISVTIPQIMDYLEVDRENFENESNKLKYYSVTNN